MALKPVCDASQIADFAQRLTKVPIELQQAAKAAIDLTASMMERKLQSIIPVGPDRNGHLKDTIKVEDGNSTLMEMIVSVGDSNLFYARALEYGHRTKSGTFVPANPFFVALTRVMNKQHRGRMTRALRKALKVAFPTP